MEGASQLIEFRGPEQLKQQEGLDLFTNLRAQIVCTPKIEHIKEGSNPIVQGISKIYQEKYSPPTMAQLTKDAKQYRIPDDRMVDEVGSVVIRLTDLCAGLKDGTVTQPSEIIRQTLNLDAELMSILLTAPPSWSYKTIKVPLVDGEPITNAVWGDNYHVYRNLSVSGVWNNARSARLLMHELLLETIKSLETSSPDNSSLHQQRILAAQSRQIGQQLVDDICASVPFHMGVGMEDYDWGLSGQESGRETHASSTWDNASSSFPITPLPWTPTPTYTTIETRASLETETANFGDLLPKMSIISPEPHRTYPLPPSFEIFGAGGVTLVWPLLIAANSGFASRDLRKWIIACLDKIGHSMGINQALAMAQLLRDGMASRAWLSPESSPTHET
jgi:hypothetical protein